MSTDKILLRTDVCMSLIEIAECYEALKNLTRQMAAEMLAKHTPCIRAPSDFVFEAAEAVTWLCLHCKQHGISSGVWVQTPKSGFIARTTHFLRGNSFSRVSRSQSMDMSCLQISLPSPTAQLHSAPPRTPISFFPKLKTPSPHNKRKSLPVRPNHSEEVFPTSPHATSFFGKLRSIDLSPTPPPDASPSFFAKLKSPFARPSITRMHSFSSAEMLPSATASNDCSPTLATALAAAGAAAVTAPISSAATTTTFFPSKSRRLPRAFDFSTDEKNTTSPASCSRERRDVKTQTFSAVRAHSKSNSLSVASTDISPKRFGAALAVPQSPRTSVSLTRKQSFSSFSSASDTSRRHSISDEENMKEDLIIKKNSEEKRQFEPLLLIRQLSGKRGSGEENKARLVKRQSEDYDSSSRHRKKSSDESKKCFDEKNNNVNVNNEGVNASISVVVNSTNMKSRHMHKSSEDKSPRTVDDNVPDRNTAVKLWRVALQMGLIQSGRVKKFGDNHSTFRFNVTALELEQSNSLTPSSNIESSTTLARASYSEIATSDPTTTTAFESIPSAEASPLDISQSHLESVFSLTPRGSSHIPGEELDGSVGNWGTTGERDKDIESAFLNAPLPPSVLFDYSELKKRDFSWPLHADAYTPISRIGKGGFADVFSAVCSTPVGPRLVAVKVMDLEKVDDALPWLMQESKVMAQLSHPNLTQIFCSFVSETSVWLVMPLAHGGSCVQIMQANHTQGFSNLGIISYIMQNVVSGLQYLHSHGLLHRDIKADNILISHEGEVMLADFGCAGVAREEKQEELELLTVPAGTRDFMSPEMVHGIGYDERTDIWSLGITAMELFMGSAPSSLREAEAMLEPPQPLDPSQGRHSRSRSISSRSPSSRSSEHLFMLDGHYHYHRRATRRHRRDNMVLFREFVDLCLSRNAASRPLAKDLLLHPFLQFPDNGKEQLVELVRSVRPATALTPHEALPSFPGYLRMDMPRTSRALSVPATPRRSSTGRNLSLQHKKTSSKDDIDFIYIFR